MYGRIPNAQELEALIFGIKSKDDFNYAAMAIFRAQFEHNIVYQQYCRQIGIDLNAVTEVELIPFLPVSFFKTAKVTAGEFEPEAVFESSGTTGLTASRHYVKDVSIYRQSFIQAFEQIYGSLDQYCIIGLLPSYLERSNSSLVYMVREWMERSGHPLNGFYLQDFEKLSATLMQLQEVGQKAIIIGVSFALLDFAIDYPQPLKNIIIMETGGMKGRKREQTREEVHLALTTAFELPFIHSEYGMTVLLSQAYSVEKGLFRTPPWMQVRLRPEDDPLSLISQNDKAVSGIINVIDLANIWSCSFIATEDVGRLYPDSSFEVLGRVDNSDVRGCSLLVV
jgi:hypothetical protein